MVIPEAALFPLNSLGDRRELIFTYMINQFTGRSPHGNIHRHGMRLKGSSFFFSCFHWPLAACHVAVDPDIPEPHLFQRVQLGLIDSGSPLSQGNMAGQGSCVFSKKYIYL